MPESQNKPISDTQYETICRLARALQYGSITLTFQDGKLVQIDKNEKIRLKK